MVYTQKQPQVKEEFAKCWNYIDEDVDNKK